MTDLKPCPICGRQPSRNGRMGSGGVVCNGPSVEVAHWVQAYGANQAEADAAWNTRPTSPATLQVPDPDVRERRHNAVATAFALLDSFAGDGLAHVYGNGQTLDASDVCVELAAAFGMEAEPGWERRVAAILAALPLDGREIVEQAATMLETAIADGYPTPANKVDQCAHGKFGWEDCINCYDDVLTSVATAIRKLAGEGE